MVLNRKYKYVVFHVNGIRTVRAINRKNGKTFVYYKGLMHDLKHQGYGRYVIEGKRGIWAVDVLHTHKPRG